LVVKLALLVALFSACASYKTSLLTCLFATIFYRNIVAKIYGVRMMPTMDLNTYYSDPKAQVLVCASILISETNFDYLEMVYRKHIHRHPKMYSSVEVIFGDPYYKKLPGGYNEALKTQLHKMDNKVIRN